MALACRRLISQLLVLLALTTGISLATPLCSFQGFFCWKLLSKSLPTMPCNLSTFTVDTYVFTSGFLILQAQDLLKTIVNSWPTSCCGVLDSMLRTGLPKPHRRDATTC